MCFAATGGCPMSQRCPSFFSLRDGQWGQPGLTIEWVTLYGQWGQQLQWTAWYLQEWPADQLWSATEAQEMLPVPLLSAQETNFKVNQKQFLRGILISLLQESGCVATVSHLGRSWQAQVGAGQQLRWQTMHCDTLKWPLSGSLRELTGFVLLSAPFAPCSQMASWREGK